MIHIVGVADGHQTRIYANVYSANCDQYNRSGGDRACNTYPSNEWITPSTDSADA